VVKIDPALKLFEKILMRGFFDQSLARLLLIFDLNTSQRLCKKVLTFCRGDAILRQEASNIGRSRRLFLIPARRPNHPNSLK